jgi:nucleoid-associated protein YgaU
MQISPKIVKTHRQFFGGRGQVFWMRNLIDQEEKEYLYQRGELGELHGYYIYYEKNPQMQEYMVQKKEKNQPFKYREQVSDAAAKSYRERMTAPKPEREKRGWQLALYTASMGVMAAVCILGVSMLNNYEHMKKLQETIATMEQTENVIESYDTSSQEETKPEEQAVAQKEETENEAVSEESVDDTAKGDDGESDLQESGEQPDAKESGETSQTAENQVETTTEEADDEVAETSAPVEISSSDVRQYLEQGYYIVEEGDSLEMISRKIYQTAAMMDQLCSVNGIEDVDKIYTGQKLILP